MEILNNIKTIFIFVSISMLVGCSASGSKFKHFESPDKNLASVYFYRPANFIGGLWTINIMEHSEKEQLNDKDSSEGIKMVGKLRNNSYFNIKTVPGEHKFTTNWFFPPFIVDLKSNRIYCIKTEHTLLSNFITSHPPLMLVPKNLCEKEIRKTKLMTKEDLDKLFY